MAMTPLPTPPARTQSGATFATNADALLSALPQFVTEANTLQTDVTARQSDVVTRQADVVAKQLLAAQNVVDAAAATAGAVAAANVTKWLTGTTYALGACVWSPINFKTYRCKVAGVSSTDPSADSATWTFPTSSGINSVGSAITASTTLTAAAAGYQPVAMTVMGQSVTLPAASLLSVGAPTFIIDNTKGGYPCGIRDNTGALLMAVAAGGEAFVSLKDNTTAAGVWSVTGSNLEPGLITIDSTFSSTYASTVLAPFVALDSNTSIHFAALSSGFAAFVVDSAGKVLTTPVTVSATASDVPCQAFKISATQAICFFKNGTSASKAVVLTISGSSPSLSLAVGAVATAATATAWTSEDFSGAPKIAQLASGLYIATNSDTTNTFATAISVSGSTVTVGTTLNIITSSSITASTTTYALTATTALVLYLSGAAGTTPVNAVVISVSGTTCTAGTPAAASTTFGTSFTVVPSVLLSATKAIILVDNNTTTAFAHAITVTGTAVSWGAALTVETGVTGFNGLCGYTANAATRYNPHLWAIGTNTAGLWYLDSSGISRAVVLTESSGTVTAGAILYRSISQAAGSADRGGAIFPQGTAEFLAFQQGGGSAVPFKFRAAAHKISGTSITVGAGSSLPDVSPANSAQLNSFNLCRLSGGDYTVIPGAFGSVEAMPVLRTNGDAINYRGSIKIPDILCLNSQTAPSLMSNRLVLLGSNSWVGSTAGLSTNQLRILNIEVAQ